MLIKLDTRSHGELIAMARLFHASARMALHDDLRDPATKAAERRAATDPADRYLGHLITD